MNKRYRLKYCGLVQGVGFRFTARSLANKHKLSGWVRNVADGGVELEIQGEDKFLNHFFNDLQNEFGCRISDYEQQEISIVSGNERFEIKF